MRVLKKRFVFVNYTTVLKKNRFAFSETVLEVFLPHFAIVPTYSTLL